MQATNRWFDSRSTRLRPHECSIKSGCSVSNVPSGQRLNVNLTLHNTDEQRLRIDMDISEAQDLLRQIANQIQWLEFYRKFGRWPNINDQAAVADLSPLKP